MDTQIYLTLLPAEVLDVIFQRLNLNDKVQLAQTDPRLGQAFAVHSRREFADMDIRKVSSMYWPVILPLCGSTVRQINGTWDSENQIPFHLIESHCLFLESIKFNVNSQNWKQITSLLLNVKTLKSVHLHINEDCHHSESIVEALTQLPSLTKLLLHGFDSELVSQLQNLIHLEDLSLNLLNYLQPLNIFEILSALQNLRTLHISNMEIIEAQNSCFNELQDLEIVDCHTYSFLPHVPKLKSLRFRRNTNYCPDFQLSKWISLHAKTLEFLELILHQLRYFDLEADDLVEILKNFKNLRTLHLVDCVTLRFLWPFMDMLKAEGFGEKRPLQLVLENFEDVKFWLFQPHYLGVVYVRSPSPWERCAWDCL